MINTQRPEDSRPVCVGQCNAISGIDDMLYMPHMSALILSNLYSTPAAGRTASLCKSFIGWRRHSFSYCSASNCKWMVYYSDGIAAGLQSGGVQGRGGCGKMVVMALSRKKGGASVRPRRVSGGVALLTYSSRDPRMDFAVNHVATMSETNG